MMVKDKQYIFYNKEEKIKEIEDLTKKLEESSPNLSMELSRERHAQLEKDALAYNEHQLLNPVNDNTSIHDLPPLAQKQVGPGSSNVYLTDKDGSPILNNQGMLQLAPRYDGPSSYRELEESK
jgi:hypothetical protein